MSIDSDILSGPSTQYYRPILRTNALNDYLSAQMRIYINNIYIRERW